jgi:hypothetical protein
VLQRLTHAARSIAVAGVSGGDGTTHRAGQETRGRAEAQYPGPLVPRGHPMLGPDRVAWRDLLAGFGAFDAVYNRLRRWVHSGSLRGLIELLTAEPELGEVRRMLLDSTIVRADPHALGLARYGPTHLGRYDAAQRACVANGWAPSSRGPHRKQPTWQGAVPSVARCPDAVEDGANALSGRAGERCPDRSPRQGPPGTGAACWWRAATLPETSAGDRQAATVHYSHPTLVRGYPPCSASSATPPAPATA